MSESRTYRRNFAFNVADGAIWQLGMAFTSVSAILPVYVSRLTTSPVLVGLIPAIVDMGWFLPQLFTAPLITRLKRAKPYVITITTFERLPFLALALVALFVPHDPPDRALAIFFALLLIRSSASGVVATGWQEMIARIIPPRQRGRFFGAQAAVGGVLSVIGAAIAREVLARYPFPLNFALCFWAGFGAILVSWLCLAQTVEPPAEHAVAGLRGRDYWRSLPLILQEDRNFRRYIVARVISSFGSMAPGFLAVAAVRRFQLGDDQAAVFSAILFGMGIVANPAWGWLGDRYGHKLTLEACSLIYGLCLCLALFAQSVWHFYLSFAALGISNAGFVIANLSIVTEFSDPAQRPTYIGLTNTLRAPIIGLSPLLGGWIAGSLGYTWLFGLTLVPMLVALVLLRWTVEEPRHTDRRR